MSDAERRDQWLKKLYDLSEKDPRKEFHVGRVKFIAGEQEFRLRPVDEVFAFRAAHRMLPIHPPLRPVNPHLAIDGKDIPRHVVNRIHRVAHGKGDLPRAGLVVIRQEIAQIPIGCPDQWGLGILAPMNPIWRKRHAESRIFLSVIIRPIEIGHLVST